MLAQCIIRPSNSTFSSPILLIKKHDDSWHFYFKYQVLNDHNVDYQVLNDRTVKDEFHIHVVNKLLVEL